jgi:sigma-B regulation protein RsbQ
MWDVELTKGISSASRCRRCQNETTNWSKKPKQLKMPAFFTHDMTAKDVIKRNRVRLIGTDGPVLLYAHGFGCSQGMWEDITPAFATTHRQVVFDYVGSGESDMTAFSTSRYAALSGYVQDVLEVCDALALGQDVTLVGHSVSGTIGILAAIERPGLFKQQVLVGPTPCFLNHPPDYHGGFERQDLEDLLHLMDQNYMGWANHLGALVSGFQAGDPVTAKLTNSFCSTDPMAARVFANATFFADNRSDLPRMPVPSLLLQHKHDVLVPVHVGEYMARRMPASTLQVLNVAGHSAHMSHPQLVVDAMRAYFARAANA